MVKYIVMLRRKPGLTKQQFLKHWKEVHGPLVARISPGIKKYIQSHPLEVPGIECEIDGIAELWFDNLEDLLRWRAWRNTEAGKPLNEDEAGLIDMSQVGRFICQEHKIV